MSEMASRTKEGLDVVHWELIGLLVVCYCCDLMWTAFFFIV